MKVSRSHSYLSDRAVFSWNLRAWRWSFSVFQLLSGVVRAAGGSANVLALRRWVVQQHHWRFVLLSLLAWFEPTTQSSASLRALVFAARDPMTHCSCSQPGEFSASPGAATCTPCSSTHIAPKPGSTICSSCPGNAQSLGPNNCVCDNGVLFCLLVVDCCCRILSAKRWPELRMSPVSCRNAVRGWPCFKRAQFLGYVRA